MTDPERCNYLYVYVNRPAYRCNGRKGDHPIGHDGQDYHSYVPREGENVTKECPCPECRQFEPMASPAEIMYAHEDRLSDGFGFYGGREAVEHVVELMLAAKDAEIAELRTRYHAILLTLESRDMTLWDMEQEPISALGYLLGHLPNGEMKV